VVESDDAQLPIWGTSGHLCDLIVNGCLDTLHAGDVGDVPGLTCHFLIRAIAKLHQLLHCSRFVSFDTVLAMNLLADAH
jgi:hypothetical protein